jgi:tetratricopeptide (TPR) repeat protein
LGDQRGDNDKLRDAIEHYERILANPQCQADQGFLSITQNNLGNALTSLGERESGTARLEEAVTAYREALKELTREQVPLGFRRVNRGSGTRQCRHCRSMETP